MTRTYGRITPPDWNHVRLYGLAAPLAVPTPVVLGLGWYSAFNDPVIRKDGRQKRYWISGFGRLEGGHAICARPETIRDTYSFWKFYDQGETPACVGFSLSRAMSLLNRKRYHGGWLYQEAHDQDGIGEPHEGTTVRAGCQILVSRGHRRVVNGHTWRPRLTEGISRYRWITSVGDVVKTLSAPGSDLYYRIGGIPLKNSWGRDYPFVTWMPFETLERLLAEDGEAVVLTDR